MQNDIPLTRDLVLIGGGHAHALVLRMWGMKPVPGVRVTIVNPGPTAPYTGMLPGFVAGHYTRDDLDIDLVKLARFAGARIIMAKATGIDIEARKIAIEGRPPINYDIASIDIGITTDMPDIDGFAKFAVPAKPLDTFAQRWDAYRGTASKPKVAVIGGGVGGIELSMAMAHALRDKDATVSIIDRSDIAGEFDEKPQGILRRELVDLGIQLYDNASVRSVHERGVELENGNQIEADFVVGVAGARAHGWLSTTGLEHQDGYLTVSETLQTSDLNVFAVGDCANLVYDPRPKAGVYAVRAAPILYHNLSVALRGNTLSPEMKSFNPQKDYLKLISLGDKAALGEKFGRIIKGGWVWKWKNHIDRTFMRKFYQLPQMAVPKIPRNAAQGVAEALGDQPMCGGCGSKVGRAALGDALTALPAPTRADVSFLSGDDAAVIQVGNATQVISTDHLRSFIEDPYDMARIAAVHALGDVWAMGGDPQAMTMTVILPRLSPELQQRMLSEIVAGASTVAKAAGAEIIGGHSSVGAELTIGFTVTGLCDGDPITLKGAQAGDAIILTKPIGTGVIMAADMQRKARGADVTTALSQMTEPQGMASRILRDHARAMTDLTGFGIAGHLSGMCDHSGVGAEIKIDSVPLLHGAYELAENSVKSSLWNENRAGVGSIFGKQGPVFDLLFDPQTAGGLMAAVRADQAEEIQKKLWLCGHHASIIGQFTESPGIKVI